MTHLPVDYKVQKSHLEKAKEVIDFEKEGSCKICTRQLEHDAGLYIVCPTVGCETVTHMACLAKHFMKDDDAEGLVPIRGNCPTCKTELVWVDLVKELSLRMRGQKEVQKLLAPKRVRKKKGEDNTLSQAIIESSETDQDSDKESDLEDDIEVMKDFASQSVGAPSGDNWHLTNNDSENSDAESITHSSQPNKPQKDKSKATLPKVIEDSDWDEAEILD
jgi:structure-specific endonuclease subunit SLX1